MTLYLFVQKKELKTAAKSMKGVLLPMKAHNTQMKTISKNPRLIETMVMRRGQYVVRSTQVITVHHFFDWVESLETDM